MSDRCFPFSRFKKEFRFVVGMVACALQFAFVCKPENAHSAERSSVGSKRISNLTWFEEQTRFVQSSITHGYGVVISGRYPAESNPLILQDGSLIPVDEKGVFTFLVPLSESQTTFLLRRVHPSGDVEQETILIQAPELDELKRKVVSTPATPAPVQVKEALNLPTRWKAFFQVFEGNSQYAELGTDFRQTALGAKLRISRQSSTSRFELNGYVSGLIWQLKASDAVKLRDLSGSAEVGLRLTPLESKWKATLSGGLHYTTLFVEPANFGFRNVAGPELSTQIIYALPNRAHVAVSARFGLMTSRYSLLTLSSHQWALGMNYHFGRGIFQTLSLIAEVSQLNIYIESSPYHLATQSLGIEYDW